MLDFAAQVRSFAYEIISLSLNLYGLWATGSNLGPSCWSSAQTAIASPLLGAASVIPV